MIVEGPSHREVVKGLKAAIAEAEDLVHPIVEEAADPRRPHPGGLRLQVKDLTDRPGLPVQAVVEMRTVPAELRLERRDHTEREDSVGGNLLMARNDLRGLTAIPLPEEKELETLWATVRSTPQEILLERFPESFSRGELPFEEVETGREPLHAMHEKGEMDRRLPGIGR